MSQGSELRNLCVSARLCIDRSNRAKLIEARAVQVGD